jgi:hypothetical protein
MLTSNLLLVLPSLDESDIKSNPLNQFPNVLNDPDFLLNNQRHHSRRDYYYTTDYLLEDIGDVKGPSAIGTAPRIEELVIERRGGFTDQESSIKKVVTNPKGGKEFYRGDTIYVSGILWDGVTYWDGETVEIYYNVSQAQFLGDIAGYRASSYRIQDVVTNSTGGFEYSIVTSDLSIDTTSKVGDITIFTWFNGNYPEGRFAGSAGSAVVTVYGQVRLDVTPTVGNRDSPYSFYVELNFENGTIATTAGTNFNIKVEWIEAGETHVDGVRTFSVSNDFLYTNTAPVAISNVTCDVNYDITNLPFYNFKVFGDVTMAETIVYNTTTRETYDKAEVQGYYDLGSVLDDTRIDVALDSFITLYANVSNSTHIMGSGYTVTLEFYNSAGIYNTSSPISTNSTGEIETMHYVDHNNFPTITGYNNFYVRFVLNPAQYAIPVQNDLLRADLTVNIGSVEVAIANPANNFYTSGLDIDFGLVVKDEFGRILPYADFSIDFPGYGPFSDSAGGSGIYNTTYSIPTYILAEQTDTKTITVDALAKTTTYYKYLLPGATQGTDLFNMYYALTLELRAIYDSDTIADGEDVDIWNNTYYSYFSPGTYNLTVTDQSGRNPVGAPFSIIFEGKSISDTVTDVVNFIELTLSFDAFGIESDAGVDLSVAGVYVLQAIAGEGDYAPGNTITQNINIYGPDNDFPTITFVGLSPDPYDPGIHAPYYNITVTVAATDVGTGIRYIELTYRILEEDNTTVAVGWTPVKMNDIGGGNFELVINTTVAQSQYFIQYYIIARDFAGHGLDDLGAKQTNPIYYYDVAFGLEDTVYSESDPDFYQVGDIEAPIEEAAPDIVSSVDPLNPYLNITLYIDDTHVDSGMGGVFLVIYIYENATGILINENGDPIVLVMTNIGGNEWYYQLPGIYNYDIVWFYVARDAATPIPNDLYGPQNIFSVVEFTPPTISNLVVDFNGTVALHDSLITFNVTVTDAITGVGNVTVFITYNGEDYTVNMTQVGTTSTYSGSFDLATAIPDEYGTYPLEYYVFAEDIVGNNVTTTVNSISVLYQNPRGGPGGFAGSWGVIIGATAGGIVAIIAVLFLWINRHTIQTFAKKQTFRRRLRDYLREIIEDIKKDGLEGRYKEGLLKTWRVVEGIGREFFNLPRYRSQTPMEFSRLLAQRGKIERELLYTLLEYFTKARYGYEEITEKDFNSGVRALLKIVDKIEVGEMQIES